MRKYHLIRIFAAAFLFSLFASSAHAAHAIYVINGRADKISAETGEWVYVDARAAYVGEKFDRWRADSTDVSFANMFSMQTRFRMPDHSVTVRADFEDDRGGTMLAIGGGCSAGASVAIFAAITAICIRLPNRATRRRSRARR